MIDFDNRYTFDDLALLRRFSGKVNDVPILLRMVGSASPGLRGYSGGNWPHKAPSSRHNFLSSSTLALSFSSMAALRDLSADTISIRAALAASLSSVSIREEKEQEREFSQNKNHKNK